MKRLLLFSCLLSAIAISGTSLEKNGISVQYNVSAEHLFMGNFGLPYILHIKNNSDKAIVVDQSIIDSSLVTHQEVVKSQRDKLKRGLLLFASAGVGSSALAAFCFKDAFDSHVTYNPTMIDFFKKRSFAYTSVSPLLLGKIMIGAAAVSFLMSAYVLHTLMTSASQESLEAKFAANAFNAPFQIQPGEMVKKIFWLKNPDDQVSIDFSAIKIVE